ncbi:MAG: RNA-binding protein [Methanomassiliicoccaceae archaeon]|nr:RNA-binding protein [Methanomassiliicoccaceae archaeon]
MERLKEAAEEAIKILHDAELRRERTVRCSRDIIRETKKMIHAIHVSEDCGGSRAALEKLVSELNAGSGSDPHAVYAGPADDALAEYAEAMILDSVIIGKGVPSFGDLGIGPGPWVMGLADCLGEMRRVVLTSLMSGDVTRAVALFSEMEDISHLIMMFDVPDQIVPIRRKQDIARGVMERTRADVANSVMMSKMKI